MSLRHITALPCAAAMLCLCAPAARAQSAFVQVLRGDTIAIERFTRTPTRLDVSMSGKGGARQVTSSRIESDGRLGAMTLTAYASSAADAAPAAEAQIDMAGDTAIASMRSGGVTAPVQRIPSRRLAQPLLSNSFAQFEAVVTAARRERTATVTVPGFFVTGGATIDIAMSGLLGDSVTMQVATVTIWMVTDTAGRIVRAGVPSQSLVVTRVTGPAASKLEQGKPDYAPPAGAPYTAETVTVPTTLGHTLGGTFTKPAGTTDRLPAVISITGSGPQDRDEQITIVPGGYRLFRQIADTLGKRGIAMLRMDDRGVGASGGSFATADSRDFANDIRAGVSYLRTRADVDPARIFLAGHSEGGSIAPMVAVEEPALAGIVLMAGPGRTGREIVRFQRRYAIEHDTTLSPSRRRALLAGMDSSVNVTMKSTRWLTFFATYDPLATARQVKVPVLLLQGGDDQQVIAAEMPLLEKAFRDGGNRDVTARVFPGLNHLFILQPGGDPAGYTTLTTNLASPQVLGALADWITAHAASVPGR